MPSWRAGAWPNRPIQKRTTHTALDRAGACSREQRASSRRDLVSDPRADRHTKVHPQREHEQHAEDEAGAAVRWVVVGQMHCALDGPRGNVAPGKDEYPEAYCSKHEGSE